MFSDGDDVGVVMSMWAFEVNKTTRVKLLYAELINESIQQEGNGRE